MESGRQGLRDVEEPARTKKVSRALVCGHDEVLRLHFQTCSHGSKTAPPPVMGLCGSSITGFCPSRLFVLSYVCPVLSCPKMRDSEMRRARSPAAAVKAVALATGPSELEGELSPRAGERKAEMKHAPYTTKPVLDEVVSRLTATSSTPNASTLDRKPSPGGIQHSQKNFKKQRPNNRNQAKHSCLSQARAGLSASPSHRAICGGKFRPPRARSSARIVLFSCHVQLV